MNTANKLSQIAKAHQQTTAKENPYESFQKKVRWSSHQYVRYVIKRCKELASKGYGSVQIKIDKTTDMFNKIESESRGYSCDFVCKLLFQEGFRFDLYSSGFVDHYDAMSFILIWDKDLPKAPDSEKIGMSWE